MGLPSDYGDSKDSALHVEQVKSSSLDRGSEHLEDLDSIEQTQSGRYAWLVAITAGVGGLLFGVYFSAFSLEKQLMMNRL
jgi:MFS transporter, SP family, solute carrier family 2 (myo-inositol transporter), member 13